MAVIFHSFGDGSFGFRSAAKRLVHQSRRSGLFDSSISWSLADIAQANPSFKEHFDWIRTHPRGLGLWVWKPYLILESLRRSSEGDILVILDSGCQLNLNSYSLQRFEDYLNFARNDGGVFMQLVSGEFQISNLTDECWTKYETNELLDPKGTLRKSNQVQSGIIILKNDSISRRLARDWVRLSTTENYRLLADPAPASIQHADFVEHRWEQSILSLLVKASDYRILPDETYFAPDWSEGNQFPIWAMRNRSGGDASRRNLLDLLLIVIARLESRLMNTSSLYKNFLMRIMGLAKSGNLSRS